MLRYVPIVFMVITMIGCSDPSKYLSKQIESYGYIPYPVPLKHAGTGTLIGGDPKALSLVAHPHTCFPYSADEETSLRLRDETTLPRKKEHFVIDAAAQVKFFDTINIGSPSIRAGTQIQEVQTIELEFDGVHIDYIDSVRLVSFYRNGMSSVCKDYLDRVGFVAQTLSVDEMVFTFYRKNTGKVAIDVDNIHEFLDLGADVDWRIEQDYRLVIETPKHIGYQLATLRAQDEGLSLMRASRVRGGEWDFKSIDIFDDDEESESWFFSSMLREEDPPDFFAELGDLDGVEIQHE